MRSMRGPAILKFFPCLTVLLSLTTAWPAEALDPFDPNFMPYQPEPVELPECGFSIGLDPSWTFEATSKEKDGNVEYKYDFDTDRTVQFRPFDLFLFNPQIHAYIKCKDSLDKKGVKRSGERLQTFAANVAKRLHKHWTEKATYLNLTDVREQDIPGLDVAYAFAAEIPPKEASEFEHGGVVLWLLGTKGERYVSGFFQFIDPTGGKNRFAKGDTASGKDKKGKEMKVELVNEATLVEKVFYGSRTLDDDHAFLLKLAGSIQ